MFLEGLVENLKYCHAFVYDIAVQTSTSETESFSSLGNIIMNMPGYGPLLNPEAEPGPPVN